jgi:2-polyprenyl-3-methyl-5-hydroxy-6-metoxy-1,4-benzoquinol methylase
MRQDADLAELRAAIARVADHSLQPVGAAVRAAQHEIGEHARPEHLELYRGEELLYWLELPSWIAEWAVASTPARILDIGGGYGTLSVFAATVTRARVTYMDTDVSRFPAIVADAHGIEVVAGNVEVDDLPHSNVDAIVLTEVIEHFNFHPVPTLRKMVASLVPGGRLFLSTPDAASWGRVEDSYASYEDMPLPDPSTSIVDRHVYQFSRDELTEALHASDFGVTRYGRSPGRWGFHHNVEAVVVAPGGDADTNS